MIALPVAEIERRANCWASVLDGAGKVIDGESMVGGGSLPGGTLPTKLVAIGTDGPHNGTGTAHTLAVQLRRRRVPVVGRVSEDLLLLDPRTVRPDEDETVIEALREVIGNL
jgi:L-seryl-tRNA(Ser) seleniumtransferase